MTLDKKTLFALLLGLSLLANILELAHVNFLALSTLLSFCTYLLLPGLLISCILRIRKISFWVNLLCIVGLGIAFLEFGGLLLNILLPLFGVDDPLAFQNLVVGFAIYLLLLFVLAWIRTKHLNVRIQFPRPSMSDFVLYGTPVLFPVLAALGAIVLNNGGSGILTLVLLGAIASYSLLLVFFRDKIPDNIFPFALFLIGLACLFTTSLRSWYITGHDIETEFYVFKLTNTHHIWNMAFYQDVYNSCLSITILPTILTNLLSIQDMYVYKVLFQILFATAPILVFFILRNYTTPVLAFLSAFLFMAFPTFFNDMPMLNRQEIGFIFFGLVLYMMLSGNRSRQLNTRLDAFPLSQPLSQTEQSNTERDIPPLPTLSLSTRRILFSIFALSVIVSHYSTNFVLLALLAFVYISTRIISLPFAKRMLALAVSKSRLKPKNTFEHTVFLSLPLLVLLFSMTYVWNDFYTHSSNHASSVVVEVFESLLVQSNAKSGDLSYSIFFAPKTDPQQALQNYINSIGQSDNSENAYNKSITDEYPTYLIPQAKLSQTPYGELLSSFDIPVFNGQAELRSFSASFLQIGVFIGLLALFFIKNKSTFDLHFLLLCVGAIFLLALITALPALSVEYGILRLFQQLLFVISLPIVLGLSSMLFFVKEQRRILLTGVVVCLFFLNLTGFVAHLTGDYYPQMTLDNAGSYYDAYYVRGSNVVAIVWLSHNDLNNDPVVTDPLAANKLLTYGDIHALSENFPALIPTNAYVYQVVSSNTIVSIDQSIFYYNSDKPFLDANKNLIYSNGQVNIYK